jgi:DNA polymerase V
MNQIIAHVDCVSFYCSVERVFQAALRERPIIVLSANDGCVVAVSPEAKETFGIVRGMPVFRIQSLIEKHQIATFSSNFVLYQDVSNRIMDVLLRFATEGRREIHSIDEAFLDVSHLAPEQLVTYGHTSVASIKRATGVPVRIGFGATKTLAKVATLLAKRDPSTQGVVDLVHLSPTARDTLLQTISIAHGMRNELYSSNEVALIHCPSH